MSYEVAMEAAGAKVLAFESFGSYQGDWFALVEYGNQRGYAYGAFGSCSGCDAFEAEFGYGDEECTEHRYASSPPSCDECDKAKVLYHERLVAFGKEYLDVILTQEEAEAKASENLSWDMDAKDVLQWLRDTGKPNESQPQPTV